MKMETLRSPETSAIFHLTNSFTSQNIILHRLRVFENCLLGKCFGPLREKVIRNLRKLQNEEIYNPYSLPGNSRAITGKTVGEVE
jgi:hypothetical protein